jgi:hypothetical protein
MTKDLSEFDVSDRQVDKSIADLAKNLRAKEDKGGDSRVLGYKTSRTVAAAVNLAWDLGIQPITQHGSEWMRYAAEAGARAFTNSEATVKNIGNFTVAATKVGIVLAKPLTQFVSVNKDFFSQRSEMISEFQDTIAGTPADLGTNTLVRAELDNLYARWKRETYSQVPDLAKAGLQGAIVFTKTTKSTDPAAPAAPDVDAGAEPAKSGSIFSRFTSGTTMEEKLAMLGTTSVATEGLVKTAVDEMTEIKKPAPLAWKKIQKLGDSMGEQMLGQEANRIRVGNIPLKKYILDVINQSEIDQGREKLGERVVEELTPAINMVADGIAKGTLDAKSGLLYLVGNQKLIKVNENGIRSFVGEEKAEAAIQELVGVNTSKDTVDAKEFYDKFADPMLAEKVVKQNMKDLKGSERAVFVSVFPDDILKLAGMNKDEIASNRKEAQSLVYDIVAAKTLELAEKDPEVLNKIGLSKKEIEGIQDLAKDIRRGNEEKVKLAVDGSDRTVARAVATATLQEQITEGTEAGEKVWTETVKKGASFREKLENGELKSKSAEGTGHADRVKPSSMEVATATERETQRRSSKGSESPTLAG